METELFYRLALNYVESCGRSTLKEILKYSGSAKNVFESPELWRKQISNKKNNHLNLKISDQIRKNVEVEIDKMEKQGIMLCNILDSNYPVRLKRCVDSPIQFFYRGGSDFNFDRILAIVGTRNASSYGIRSVSKILNELKGSNIVTISGLAYGIDTATHEESLNHNIPTIAVLGSGLGTIYPSINRSLSDRIIDSGGTLITEFSYDIGPERVNFPQRNRIIAGMADAILVAETGYKGGSIITAHIAHTYNRDIFAIPGSIFEESFAGCNNLIRKNIAAVATSGADILELMNWDKVAKPHQIELFVELEEDEQYIFDYVKVQPRSIDDITEYCKNFTPSKIAAILLCLELKGVITALPGKRYGCCV